MKKLAIKWRTNTFNLQGNCFCERPFLRSHVDRCFKPLVKCVVEGETEMDWDELESSREKEIAKHDLDDNYTCMDVLLNSANNWYSGVKILHKIQRWARGEIWIHRIDGWDTKEQEEQDTTLGEREEAVKQEALLPT